MNQLQVNEINDNISFEEGKIYWKPNKHWTSELMENLIGLGWSIKEFRGLVDIYDNEDNRIVWNALGRVNALKELADVLK